MNRRETLGMYRVAVMRQRYRQAAQRARATAPDDCVCPACVFRRTLMQQVLPSVTQAAAPDDGTTKH